VIKYVAMRPMWATLAGKSLMQISAPPMHIRWGKDISENKGMCLLLVLAKANTQYVALQRTQ